MVSLPIPSRYGRPLGDIEGPCGVLHSLVSDLTAGRLNAETLVHLDPDLRAKSVPRRDDWRPCFGQTSSAQGHLARQGVGVGDVFLFFGWFRQAERIGEHWRFVQGAPDIHCIFGWLQVGEVVPVNPASIAELPLWLQDHPHVAFAGQMSSGNTLYLAADGLFDGRLSGAGCFDLWYPKRQLTAPGRSRSVWRLPAWMDPSMGDTKLSYHTDQERWHLEGDATLLETVAKGQEFVMDIGLSESARDWLREIIQQDDM